jgi:hypothetical protein
MAHGNKGELTSARCAFSVSVQRLPGIFNKTCTVTLLPRFIIFNKTDLMIDVFPFLLGARQLTPSATELATLLRARANEGAEQLSLVPNGSGVCYSFTDLSDAGFTAAPAHAKTRNRRIALRSYASELLETDSIGLPVASAEMTKALPPIDSPLSQSISCNEVGDQYIWLPESRQGGEIAFRVAQASIILDDTTVVITLQDSSHTPPYRIQNRASTAKISFRQPGSGEIWRTLAPHSWCSYVLADASQPHRLEVAVAGLEEQSQVYSIEEVASLPRLRYRRPGSGGAREVVSFLAGDARVEVLPLVSCCSSSSLPSRLALFPSSFLPFFLSFFLSFFDFSPFLSSLFFIFRSSLFSLSSILPFFYFCVLSFFLPFQTSVSFTVQ